MAHTRSYIEYVWRAKGTSSTAKVDLFLEDGAPLVEWVSQFFSSKLELVNSFTFVNSSSLPDNPDAIFYRTLTDAKKELEVLATQSISTPTPTPEQEQFIKYVVTDLTPIGSVGNKVTVTLNISDAIAFNTWVRTQYPIGISISQQTVVNPSFVETLSNAKQFMINMMSRVEEPIPSPSDGGTQEPDPGSQDPEPPTPPPPTSEPTPTQPPDNSWVTISPGIFNLENNRLTGEILYIAQNNFQLEFSPVDSIVQITDSSGTAVTTPKFNNLNFTATERDERIQINESAGGLTSVTVQIFVRTKQGIALASPVSFTVNLADPPQVPPTAPGLQSNTITKVIAGLFMGGVALAFMKGIKK